MNRHTFWWRLRSSLYATLVSFGWRRRPAYAALTRREPWWRRAWHVCRPESAPPQTAYSGPPPWVQPSEAELGVAVPLGEVLASDEGVVIGLIDCIAYSTGFEFRIAVRSKRDLDSAALGFGPPPPYGPDRSDRELTLGIQFADGSAAFTGGGHPGPEFMAQWKMHAEGREPSPSDGPLLMPRGGGGGGKRYDFAYWVWPLPPEGKLTFLCEWRARGLGPTSHAIDAAGIRQAGASSTSFWSGG